MSLIHTYSNISQLKGGYKIVITQPLKIIGKSILFFLENILDNNISTCDNKPYLKNRKLLKKIEIGRGNTLKINN